MCENTSVFIRSCIRVVTSVCARARECMCVCVRKGGECKEENL